MKGKTFAFQYANLKAHSYNLELCKDMLTLKDDEFLTQEALKVLEKHQNKLKRKLNRLENMKVK